MKTNKKTLLKLIIILMLILSVYRADNCFCSLSNARSTAMAGAYIGLAKGVEAAVWNPANLGLTNNNFSINVINIGAGIHNNSFTKRQYDMYNGDSLTTIDINNILNSVPSSGFELFINSESQLLSFSSGHFAFSIEALVNSQLQLDKSFLELVFKGNEDINRVYNFDNSGGEAYAVVSYNLSGALPIKLSKFDNFSIGATIKYLQGFAYLNVLETKGSMVSTPELQGQGKAVLNIGSNGKGIGLDIGVASKKNQWTFSLVFKNALSNIQWMNEVKEKSYSFVLNPITLESYNKTDPDSIFTSSEQETSLKTISSSLPAKLHLGVLYNKNKINLSADYIQGLNDRPGCSKKPQFAFGLQYQLWKWMPIRTGFAVGGNEGFISAAGFGLKLGPVAFDFGVSNRGGIFLGNQHGLNLAAGVGFWF